MRTKLTREWFLRAIQPLRGNNRKFFVIFSVVMISLFIDSAISGFADTVSKLTVSFWGITLFVIIAVIFGLGQYFILEIVKTTDKRNPVKPHNIDTMEKMMTVTQYVLIAIMIIVVLQIILFSYYYTNLLTIATIISYGLTTFLMSLLAYRFFSWFNINRSLVVLLFGLATAMITVNAIDSIIINVVPLLGKTSIVSPQSPVIYETGYSPGTVMSVVAWLQSNSVLGYIILTWAGTIFLLRVHIRRVGRVKFWIIVTLPLVYFMTYNISLFQTLYPNSPVTTVTSSPLIPLLMLDTATTLCGILFGIAFWSVSRSLSQESHVRDYMIITAYGFTLFFTAAQAGVLQAGYPSFGLASVSFVGLTSYLILAGLYNSAISVAQDGKLRKSIKNSVLQQSSNLLDNIGTAQMTKEIEEKVMRMTQYNSNILKEQSGVEPSLTDHEIKIYVDKVLEEMKVKKK